MITIDYYLLLYHSLIFFHCHFYNKQHYSSLFFVLVFIISFYSSLNKKVCIWSLSLYLFHLYCLKNIRCKIYENKKHKTMTYQTTHTFLLVLHLIYSHHAFISCKWKSWWKVNWVTCQIEKGASRCANFIFLFIYFFDLVVFILCFLAM